MIHNKELINLTWAYNNKYRLSKKHSIYDAIIKLNTRSPLYMFQLSNENQSYVLDLKKSAFEIVSVLNEYNVPKKDSVFNLKKVTSGNEKIAQVEIIDSSNENLPEEFTLKVNQLATSQINSGSEVSSGNKSLSIGTYVFSIEIEDNIYEFQYNITEKSTNKENLIKLINFINRSNVGIMASFVENHKIETVQSVLKTAYTGSTGQLSFTIKDIPNTTSSRGIVEYFGLNNVLQYPTNSIFEINGITKESISNSFTYNKAIKIKLNSISNEEIPITYTPDTEKILDSFSDVSSAYNKLIDLVDIQGGSQKTSIILKNELFNIFNDYLSELESLGLNLDYDGKMILNRSIAHYAAEDGSIEKLLTEQDGYLIKLQYKMNQIMLDPMNYLDKKIVTYPNTMKPPFHNPYIISVYSGMIYNYYC